jgi:hypothetical protein
MDIVAALQPIIVISTMGFVLPINRTEVLVTIPQNASTEIALAGCVAIPPAMVNANRVLLLKSRTVQTENAASNRSERPASERVRAYPIPYKTARNSVTKMELVNIQAPTSAHWAIGAYQDNAQRLALATVRAMNVVDNRFSVRFQRVFVQRRSPTEPNAPKTKNASTTIA